MRGVGPGRSANTEEIAAGITGGIVLVLAVVLLVVYRNWRYEQELDSLLWKIDYKDIQIIDLPSVSGQGKVPRVKKLNYDSFMLLHNYPSLCLSIHWFEIG